MTNARFALIAAVFLAGSVQAADPTMDSFQQPAAPAAPAKDTPAPAKPEDKNEPPAGELPVGWFAMKGKLVDMICQEPGRMILDTAAGTKEFVIPDPSKLVVTGTGEGRAELSCGKQEPPRPMRMVYTAAPATDAKAAGTAREVHFE